LNILVDRIVSNHDVTISRVYINDLFFCHGLEDEYRVRKIPGETRIPAGCYDLGVRAEGGFHQRYQTLFPNEHRGMIEIQNVRDFRWVLIHVGNYARDTAGCLLLGRADYDAWAVWQSKATYRRFYREVFEAVEANEATILFLDNDR